ncbi:hypothetical protein QJS10_CPB14g01637 [Acorus calamus]|uniref:Peptidase M48 domain-containing protein n=1 Tax=Acorus calamus TaxID=4465 RepID=A0AAV9DC33_ACOCL|nr:hypothetical protein QJS10_CPB14g01637 [Acorus calamus]
MIVIGVAVYLQTVPYTKRTRFVFFPVYLEKKFGELLCSGLDLYFEYLPSSHPQSVQVTQIFKEVIDGLHRDLRKERHGDMEFSRNYLGDLNWEVFVVRTDLDTPDYARGLATAFVGVGKVYITTSMLDWLESDAEIAAVLSHEVGHCVARHVAEKVNKKLWFNMFQLIVLPFVRKPKHAKYTTDVLLKLPFRRRAKSALNSFRCITSKPKLSNLKQQQQQQLSPKRHAPNQNQPYHPFSVSSSSLITTSKFNTTHGRRGLEGRRRFYSINQFVHPNRRRCHRVIYYFAGVSMIVIGVAVYHQNLQTVPYTKRTRFVFFPVYLEKKFGEFLCSVLDLYHQYLPSSHPQSVQVTQIFKEVIDGLHRDLRKERHGDMEFSRNYLGDLNWEVFVVRTDLDTPYLGTPDAFGGLGKVYITTSMLDWLESDAEIAAILSHEVGHCVARHVAEDVNKKLWFNMFQLIVLPFVRKLKHAKYTTDVLLRLPYSRRYES